MADFLKNCWYMAAWASEVTDGLLARRLLDIPMVFFRDQDGVVAGLHDRCPHRFAPLSMGKVENGTIRCGYHGLGFDKAGQCVASPFGLKVPPGTVTRAFAVAEKDGCIWFWPGEQHLADPSTIPDFHYHSDSAFRVVKGRSNINANYELVTDNLMDLTHTRYLHPIFGGEGWTPECSFDQDGDTVYSRYVLPSYPPSEFSAGFLSPDGGNVFEREHMRWTAPANMYLHIEFSFAEDPGQVQGLNPSSHILTPETATKTHYFWASGAPADSPMTDEEHYEGVKYAFDHEDAPMLEAVQNALGETDFWKAHPAILANDSGAIRARRILRQKLRAESPGEPALEPA